MADFTVPDHIITFVVGLLLTALVVHIAASLAVPGKQGYLQAILVAFLGNLLAGLVLIGTGASNLGIFLAAAAWALVAAIVYHTSWLRGAFVGIVAWILWAIIVAVLRALG
jgi:hypothetical protein